MSDVKILDCSLRDGGYRTQWNFSRKRVQSLLDTAALSKIQYLEFGFASPRRKFGEGPFAAVSDELLQRFSTHDLAVGFMVEAKNIASSASPSKYIEEVLDITRSFRFVRVAANIGELDSVNLLSQIASERGITLMANLMRASELHDEDVVTFFSGLDKSVKGLYLADSFGALTPERTFELVSAIPHWAGVEIGFHAHNNRGMALANVRAARSAGATIIDGTWAGHGRGSGNARLEELLVELGEEPLGKETLFHIGDHLERYEYSEGRVRDESSFAFHFGAACGAHPNLVSDLLHPENGLSLAEVLEALDSKKAVLDGEQLGIHSFVRLSENIDSEISPQLRELTLGKVCIVVGSAPNEFDSLLEVELLIGRADVFVATLNGRVKDLETAPDATFVLHHHRMRQAANDFLGQNVALISPFTLDADSPPITIACGAAFPQKFGSPIEDGKVPIESGTTLAYALAALAYGGAQSIVLVGIGGGLDPERQREENAIIKSFTEAFPAIKLASIGNSIYGLEVLNPWAHPKTRA